MMQVSKVIGVVAFGAQALKVKPLSDGDGQGTTGTKKKMLAGLLMAAVPGSAMAADNCEDFLDGNRNLQITEDMLDSAGCFRCEGMPELSGWIEAANNDNLTAIEMFDLEYVVDRIFLNDNNNLERITLPNLISVFNELRIEEHASLENLLFPGLKYVGKALNLNGLENLQSFHAPILEQIGLNYDENTQAVPDAILFIGMPELTDVTMPQLDRVDGQMKFINLPSMQELDLSSVTNATAQDGLGYLNLQGDMGSLTKVDLSLLKDPDQPDLNIQADDSVPSDCIVEIPPYGPDAVTERPCRPE